MWWYFCFKLFVNTTSFLKVKLRCLNWQVMQIDLREYCAKNWNINPWENFLETCCLLLFTGAFNFQISLWNLRGWQVSNSSCKRTNQLKLRLLHLPFLCRPHSLNSQWLVSCHLPKCSHHIVTELQWKGRRWQTTCLKKVGATEAFIN